MTRLINIDNGGTLTDVCIVDGNGVRYTKTLTTPFDLSRCLFDGLTKASRLVYGEERLAALLQAIDYIRYSTTQGTNALVQRQGPRLGLLAADSTLVEGLAATAEEEDLLSALVGDRHAVIDVTADDETLAAQLVARVNELAAAGASRLVVSIGGADGAAQENRVKRMLLRLYPRHLLGAIPLLFSWELAADRDDMRRTWSGLLNAFLHPAMERFLFNAEQRLRDHRARRPLLIFRNDGGSSRVAKSAALKTYSSGPRGGLEGTRALARGYGFRHVLMLDVGGTTSDIGVVADGAVRVDRRGRIERVPTSFELAAITSHGVGGSSVIRVADGAITVGPDSVAPPRGLRASAWAAPKPRSPTSTCSPGCSTRNLPRRVTQARRRAQPQGGSGAHRRSARHRYRRGARPDGGGLPAAARGRAAYRGVGTGHRDRGLRRRRPDVGVRCCAPGRGQARDHSPYRRHLQRVRHRVLRHLADLRVPADRRRHRDAR